MNVSVCKSLLIRKEAKNASTPTTNDLLGGATFTISPNPTTGAPGASRRHGQRDGRRELDPGLVCVKVGAGGPFSISEKTAPSNYLKDNTNFTNIPAANSDCATRSTAPGSEDVKFVNTPLSEIVVDFNSSAGPGVTKARVDCGTTSTGIGLTRTPSDGTPTDLDDDTENYPRVSHHGTYFCRVEIDP